MSQAVVAIIGQANLTPPFSSNQPTETNVRKSYLPANSVIYTVAQT